MRNNIITATAGDSLYIKTEQAFQYDYGLRLVIDGVQLPEEYEVHFSNTGKKVSKTVTGDSTGVLVPDEYLRDGENIHAWIYLHTGEEDGETVYHIEIPVISRAAIGEEELTPIEHDIIKRTIEYIKGALIDMEENVSNYPYINDDKYWMVYDADRNEYVNTGVKAQGDNTFNLRIGTVTTLAPGAEAMASIVWEDGNATMNLGIPAGDASAAVSIHDERSNAASVSINDGANHIGLDELAVTVEPVLAGSGTQGPRNIRRISGAESLTVRHTHGETYTDYEWTFDEPVYGGTFYPLTGRMVVDHVLMTKRCADMDNSDVQPGWKNSGIRELIGEGVSQIFENEVLNVGTTYGVDTTGDNDILYLGLDQYHMRQSEWINTEINVQLCVRLAEPIEFQLSPGSVRTELGENTYSVTGGKIAYMKYPCDTKLYVDHKIAEVQALVLEH